VLPLSTRILVIYNGERGALFPDTTGLAGRDPGPYMLGVKREEAVDGEARP